ncbi:MAG: outer membrane protein assembly factor BamB family protein [Caulobacteraceae bacterium]
MSKWIFLGLVALGLATASDAARGQAPPANAANGASAFTENGFGIFQSKCLSCHGKPQFERAPSPAALREMTPEHLFDVLSNGVMYPVVGKDLSGRERRQVAESIAGRLMGTALSGDAARMPSRCASNPPLSALPGKADWNGWGADGDNSRYQTTAKAALTPDQVKRLKLKWAFGFPDGSSAYGQPSIVAGRVFVGADTGYVYSLDAQTGCVHWSFQAKAGVRNAMSVAVAGGKAMVFFGDLKANVYGLDAQTGQQVWTNHVEDNFTDRVTAAPAVYDGRLFVPISSWEEFRAADPTYGCCTSVGALASLDAATGKTLWKRYVIDPRPAPTRKNASGAQQWGPAGGSVWNTPTVDPARRAVYVGTGDATTYPAAATSDAIMAFDMDSGRTLWSYQVHHNDAFLVGCDARAGPKPENCPPVVGPDWDIPTSPILRTLTGGQRALIVGTKPGDVLALDPDKGGALLWRKNVSGGAIAGDGPAYPSGKREGIQWGGAASAEAVYYGLTSGGVAALRLKDGERAWFAPLDKPTNPRANHSAAVTAWPGVVMAGGANGKLFAVSDKDGSLLWSFDTARPFDTVNKTPAKGGSIAAPGPTVAGGMVFVGSGYAIVADEPGNVLLAFAPD